MINHYDSKAELFRVEKHRDMLMDMWYLASVKAEPSIRLLLLFASLLKIRQQARAVQLLSVEVCVEEILAISRTMTEVAINAAYLQFAEDIEVDRYQHFDTQSLYKHSQNLRPHITSPLTAEQQLEIDSEAALARSLTNKKDTEISWSTRSLIKRAEYADEKSGQKLMNRLALTVYAFGHHSVHGTNSSLRPFYTALNNGSIPIGEERFHDLGQALYGINFVLYVFGIFVNSLLKLGKEREISNIQNSTT